VSVSSNPIYIRIFYLFYYQNKMGQDVCQAGQPPGRNGLESIENVGIKTRSFVIGYIVGFLKIKSSDGSLALSRKSSTSAADLTGKIPEDLIGWKVELLFTNAGNDPTSQTSDGPF
jgi:hypothetical protein